MGRLRERLCSHEHSTWDEVEVKNDDGTTSRVKVFRCSGCSLVRERNTTDVRPTKREWDKRFSVSSDDAAWLRWVRRHVTTGQEPPSANIRKEKVRS